MMSVTIGTSKPGAQAQYDSVVLPFPEIVDRLRRVIGARLVAYIGGVKETRAVREWVESNRTPSAEGTQRLRTAYAAAAMLAERYDATTVSSWFQGMNPQLSDVAPAWALREQPLEKAGPSVISAAKTFLAFG